ncbi:hypothetical protein [Ktedonospora formicarum]|uniref:Uncharacterized protein n=1 Tax=Ktedonospora formicarum TaxID=2778364 RepID=A0A8J3HX16_9CHLR|nr:hypothetical protein [Ktedonospora formicarum]GHO44811.1 hypothetical protein KSX_29740 [Ktedonospora formicarum]
MQQSRKPRHQSRRLFTASELASYEHCSLAWWHEHYDPIAQGNDDELFARLVEMENKHDAQAPSLPEYHVVEQLLLRRGAFEDENARQREGTDVEEMADERIITPGSEGAMRRLVPVILGLVVLSLLLIISSAFLK